MTPIDVPDVTVVTGATGWLGRALMAALAVDRPQVRPLVTTRSEADLLRDLGAHVSPVVGDVRSADDLRRLIGVDADSIDVIHAAGVIHPGSVAEFTDVNATGSRHVLDAALACGVRRLVHVSSNSPFGTNPDPNDHFRDDEPFNPYLGYGRSKMAAELAVHDAVDRGLNAVIVRPPWFYGPHQPARQTTFFSLVRRGMFPVFGGGAQRRSMVYIDNLVDGVVRAELTPTAPGRAWWIADAEPYTVNEIVTTVRDALRSEGYDVRPHRARVPDIVANVAERVDSFIQARGRYHQQIHVLGEMNKNIACSIDGARRELGYDPQVALAEGMRRSIRWCREQGIEL